MFITCKYGTLDTADAVINKNRQKTLRAINLDQILNQEVKKEKLIEFAANEKKILLLNFSIVVLQWSRLQIGETIMIWINKLIAYKQSFKIFF